MIVKMKKITLLIAESYRDDALESLRKLGVLHVEDVKPPVSDDLAAIEKKMENVDKALTVIKIDSDQSAPSDAEPAEQIVEQIITLNHQRETLKRELEEKQEINHWFEHWGNISFSSIQSLRDSGIFVRFYVADRKAFQKIAADKNVHPAGEEQNTVRFALFSESADEKLEFKEEPIPEIEYIELKNEIESLSREIDEIAAKLDEFSSYRDGVKQYRTDLLKKIEFSRVRAGMGEETSIVYLQGYCPAENVDQIKQHATERGWGYIIDDPDDPAEVPTLLRNPKWVNMIKPLFDFMGTLPGYFEPDVSLVFLVFFSIFYALIVGDAGYGLVFLLGTVVLHLKKKDQLKDFIRLMYLVSSVTIVWGLITGTWFGAEKIAQLPILKLFVIEQISSFNPNSGDFIMRLTFVIGVVHLSLGHLITAFRKINSLTALAEIGWVLVLWAVFFVANSIVLGKEMSAATMPLLIAGVALILVFANFQKNIVKGMLLTLGNLPLDIISSFSDVVSYIRLFAVGLATVIVASSFNEMAIGAGIDSVIGGIFAAIILFIGHAINLVLCGMSILVHGVRLNMLEFSGHVGIQWTGKPYQPFKE